MPPGFELKDHGLRKLRVAVLQSLVFATFSKDTEPLQDYLGPHIMPWLNRIFKGPDGTRSEVCNVGRYIDEIMKKDDSLKFRSRLCVYDSERILNSLIYPI